MIILKSNMQIDLMNRANEIVHSVLDTAEKSIQSGMTTEELDNIMESKLSEFDGATSAFKGYKGFPAVSCISINEEVVHGIPGKRIIRSGDIVSVDFGVYYKGFAGDSARTFIIGEVKSEVKKLVDDTYNSLLKGIEQMVPGNRLYDIAEAIDNVAMMCKYGNVKEFCGHGIGSAMHESPSVFNYINHREPNIRLQEGLVLALEPMFILGPSDVFIDKDNWTVKTKNGNLACHWEFSVAITKNGPRILGHNILNEKK